MSNTTNRYEKRIREEWRGVLAEFEAFNKLMLPILSEIRSADASSEITELHAAYVRWQDKYNAFYRDGDPHRCAYCGAMFDNEKGDELKKHILECSDHPLAEAKALLSEVLEYVSVGDIGFSLMTRIKEFLNG